MGREIHIDRKRSASLRKPNSTLQFLDVETAVNHWRKLPTEEKRNAVLVLVTGEIYQSAEIDLIRFD